MGEKGLIERLRRKHLSWAAGVDVGLGDDAAVLRGRGRSRWLLTSDMLVEGVHFTRHTPPSEIGWKALACNLSDIAAMAGKPLWAVVSLGLPPLTRTQFVDAVYEGLARCARRFRMAIVGGDTVRAPRVIVDVAIVGTVRSDQLILRRGARVGDALFVTGHLGGSLSSGRHTRFVPRVREAQHLRRRVRINAMIDLSDGLASDLWQMSRASRVVMRIQAARIPVARAARTCLPRRLRDEGVRRRQALQHALMDGEDFELLFAVSARMAQRVPLRIGSCPVTRIGCVVRRGVNVELEDARGRVRQLRPKGFRHF